MFGSSEKKEDCPFWRGACREHKCRLYIQLMGANPNTGEQINKWGCSFEFLPMLLIENSQQARRLGAATESMRNELVTAVERSTAIMIANARAPNGWIKSDQHNDRQQRLIDG